MWIFDYDEALNFASSRVSSSGQKALVLMTRRLLLPIMEAACGSMWCLLWRGRHLACQHLLMRWATCHIARGLKKQPFSPCCVFKVSSNMKLKVLQFGSVGTRSDHWPGSDSLKLWWNWQKASCTTPNDIVVESTGCRRPRNRAIGQEEHENAAVRDAVSKRGRSLQK